MLWIGTDAGVDEEVQDIVWTWIPSSAYPVSFTDTTPSELTSRTS